MSGFGSDPVRRLVTALRPACATRGHCARNADSGRVASVAGATAKRRLRGALRPPQLRGAPVFAVAAAVVIAGCGTGAASTAPGSATVSRNLSAIDATGARVAAPSSAQPVVSLEQQYVAAVKRILPAIVQIRTSLGLGSGVVFDARGDIVTNAHVAADSTSFAVTLADGRQYTGRLVGTYPADDLAVLTIGAHGAKPAAFADSSHLVVGDIVLAAGNPLGLQSSVTDGIVSALGRDVSEGGGIVLPSTIQTSAAINPGNSGGALVDLAGKVVGIPTLAAATSNGAAAGIGFAIPSNLVRDIAEQIIRNGHVVNSHRAALGVSVADSLVRAGAIVVAVQKGGPADRAGIIAGNAIVAMNGTAVPDTEAFATALAAHRPGQAVKVTVSQTDGKSKTVTVKLGELAAA